MTSLPFFHPIFMGAKKELKQVSFNYIYIKNLSTLIFFGGMNEKWKQWNPQIALLPSYLEYKNILLMYFQDIETKRRYQLYDSWDVNIFCFKLWKPSNKPFLSLPLIFDANKKLREIEHVLLPHSLHFFLMKSER